MKPNKHFTIFSIILYVIISLVVTIIHFIITKDTGKPFLEILYYATQILSSIFVTIGFIIAFWQYYLVSEANKKNMDKERIQKAIDLSEYYKNNILVYIPAIRYIFDESGASKVLQSINSKKFINFNKRELTSLFTQSQIEYLKKLQESENFLHSIFDADRIFNLHLDIKYSPKKVETDSEKYSAIIEIDKSSIYIEFMSNLINSTLNNMEFFALHFKHGTADESVVYQSLHQTYLSAMPYLYYYIANNNTDPSNKLYTNVIWLYNEWSKEKQKQEQASQDHESEISRTGTVIE